MIKVVELFGGIGACTQAFKRLCVEHKVVDYVEIDKYAVKSYNAINGTNFEPQDISKWDKNIEVDFIMHGSPCQSFSIAGKQEGGDEGSGTRSSLMYETIRIVEKLRPKYVLWENVSNVLSDEHVHNFNKYLTKMQQLGYGNTAEVLNARDFGVPQNRERIFVLSIYGEADGGFFGMGYEFPKGFKLTKTIKDILEEEVDIKYYIDNDRVRELIGKIKENTVIDFSQSKREPEPRMYEEVAPTIAARDYKDPRCVSVPVMTELEPKILEERTDEGLRGFKDNICGTLRTTDSCGDKRVLENKKLNVKPILTPDRLEKRQNGRRVKEEHEPMFTLTTQDRHGVVLETPFLYDDTKSEEFGGGAIHSDTTPCLRASKNGHKIVESEIRIRKLTPKECWRLMGFDDECFCKAEIVNSNSQLYKQAGNSIVVDVLCEIIGNINGLYKNTKMC